MKYKIKFNGKEKEVESTQPQTALNKAFFGERQYDKKEIKPIFKLPEQEITITNSNGRTWKQNLFYSYFTDVG